MNQNAIVSPGKGWKLICRRGLTAGGMIYPAGSEISAEDCGRNYRVWHDTGAIWWAPPSQNVVAKAVRLPEQPKLLPRPKIEFVMVENDPVESWRKTRARYIEACGGVVSRADDWLMADSAARDLCRSATQLACAKAKEGRKLQSVTPDMVEGL